MHLSSDTLREILVKLLEKGNAIGSAIEVVQVYDIGDTGKTKLISAQRAGNTSLQPNPYNCMTAHKD